MYKIIVAMLVAVQLQSCMLFVPKVSENNDPGCETITRQLDLDVTDLNNDSNCTDSECLAVFLAGVAGSFIVSGSVVLANNVIHWAEYSNNCKAFEQQSLHPEKKCVQECDLETQKCTCIN